MPEHSEAAIGMRYNKSEDINGYVRGAHKNGTDICPGFEFHLPGSQSTPGNVIWGWNDIEAFKCERCKRPDVEHIVLREPVIPELKPKVERAVERPVEVATDSASGAMRDPTSANPRPYFDTAARRAREAAADAFFSAGYSPDDGMLDESCDPLAINARPKPKPAPASPPPQPAPVEPHHTVAAPAAAPAPLHAVAGAVPTAPGDLAEGVQDPALQELLARDASANEAFKREVERMVREANRQKELDEREVAQSAPVVGKRVAESKNLAGCAVPRGHFATTADLLTPLGLSQHAGAFEDEAMDPDTLIDVLEHQGKAALDEALKELGVTSMGHRIKITNALLVH